MNYLSQRGASWRLFSPDELVESSTLQAQCPDLVHSEMQLLALFLALYSLFLFLPHSTPLFSSLSLCTYAVYWPPRGGRNHKLSYYKTQPLPDCSWLQGGSP